VSEGIPLNHKPNLWATIERSSVIGIVVGMTLIVFWGMLVRYLPIRGGPLLLGCEELGRLSLILLWAWGGGLAHRFDKHYKLDVLTDRVSNQTVLFVVTTIGDIILLGLMFYYFRNSIQLSIRELPNTTLNLQWPYIIFTIPLTIGSLLIGVFTLIRLAVRIKESFTGK
jgi:TRAP-type C4-dicarboxylate transport system permease small subunit